MVDYKKIADGDSGGNLTSTFNSMSNETQNTTPEMRMTYLSVSRDVGFTQSKALQGAVKAAEATGLLPEWVDKNLTVGGIDINDPQTGDILRSLVPASANFTLKIANSIIASGVVEVEAYPGLKEGHLQNARQMRLRSEV